MRKRVGLLSLLFFSSIARADYRLNLSVGVTPISHDIYMLHMIVFWVCVAIGVVVFGAMFYAIFYHRKSRGRKAAQFHEQFWLEITWSLIPFLILIGMAVPATLVLMNMDNDDRVEITIKVTGYQWKWRYEYLEDGISFFSNLKTSQDEIHNKKPKGEHYLREVDNPLVLPIHKKIRFVVTSNDVIHSWWVPDFGIKRDAIPGYINESWARIDKPGRYEGQCAELCGMNHGFMPIVVNAVTEPEYATWVTQQKGGVAPVAAPPAPTPTPPAPVASTPTPAAKPTAPVKPASQLAPEKTPLAKRAEKKAEETEMKAIAAATKAAAAATQAAAAAAKAAEAAEKAAKEIEGMVPASQVQPTPAAQPAVPTPAPTAPSQPAPVAKPAVPTPAPTAPNQPAPAAKPTPQAAAASAAGQKTLQELMQRGQQIFDNTCAMCHQASGEGMPPMYPALKGSPIATGPIAAHLDRVLNGKPGTAMQAFKDQFNDDDLAAVITYERNAFGNNKGDTVQPSEVKAARALPPAG